MNNKQAAELQKQAHEALEKQVKKEIY